MSKLHKFNIKKGLFIAIISAIITIFLCLQPKANFIPNKKIHLSDTVPATKSAAVIKDSSQSKDTSQLKDTTIKVVDTLNSRDSLNAPVDYKAEDSGVMNMSKKEFYLFGKANVKYEQRTLDAATIKYDQQNQLVQAYGALDTSHNPMSNPTLKDGEKTAISDSINLNLKNMKALTKGTIYTEGEIIVHAQDLKKVGKDYYSGKEVYYGENALFTTCNLDTPHFAIRTKRMKLITDKLAVSGPAFPVIEGIPIPVGIPFGIYPLTQGRHSGVIGPQFTSNDLMGFGIEGLGYYKVFSDYWDATFLTDIYSYGGWRLGINPKYMKRYRYTGAFNISLQRTVQLNNSYSYFSQDEYSKSFNYSIQWTHSRDNRARPGTNFSTNVNFASTRYNKNVPNYPQLNFQNSLSSSISYTKDFRGKGNLSVNLNHSQNNNTHLVTLNLPTVSFNLTPFYPFQKKDFAGTPKWWQSFSLGYNTNFQNTFAYYDTAFSFKKMLDTAQWGATHNFPISITLPSLGPFTFQPSISYSQRWLAQQYDHYWLPDSNKVFLKLDKGLYIQHNMSFGFSTSTRIFGLYKLKQSGTQIRHVVQPSVGFAYTPNFLSQNDYQRVQIDTVEGGHYRYFSKYDGSTSGGNFIKPKSSGSITFGIENTLEMKVKDKKDTSASAMKKIKLLDGFGISSSYDLLADSFALAPFSFHASSTLFQKINLTASASLNPYAIDKHGYEINKLMITENHKIGRITNAQIAISTQFKSKSKDGNDSAKSRINVDPFMTPEEQQRQLSYARSNPADFTDFNIPWSLSLSYSLSYSRNIQTDSTGRYKYFTQVTSGVNFNGDFSLTPKWKAGASGFYDVSNLKLNMFTLWVSREMHCWQMSINVTPIGITRSFSITLSPKSGLLRDLRINRNRSYYNY